MTEKIETMTTTGGNPVADNQNSVTAGPRGPLLMQDYQLLEKLAHQNRGRIPERTVSLLLDHGADIEADNGGGMTPLMFAALFGRHKVVEHLKARGASLEHRNRFGFSAGLLVRLCLRIGRLPQELRF